MRRTRKCVAGLGVVTLLAAACSTPPARRHVPRRPVAAQSTSTAPRATTTTTQPADRATLPATTTPTISPEKAGHLYGKIWQQIPTAAHVVALTFDAGANGNGVPSILSTLRTAGVPATFFLTGSFAGTFPAYSRSMVGAGYRVGNHTVGHPHLPALSDANVTAEVTDAAATITAVTGASPLPLFRFPYGDSDSRTLTVVNSLGYVAVGWTVDTLGWEGSSAGITPASIVARVMAGLRPGEIVLMHVGSNPNDGSTLDADSLASMIASIEAAGYSFVTLDALLQSGS